MHHFEFVQALEKSKRFMKLLYIMHLSHRLNQFSASSMLAVQQLGAEFHIASNWSYPTETAIMEDEIRYKVKIHQIDFFRHPLHPRNIKAYHQLCALMKKEKFDIIHCNTPTGGIFGRLAALQCGQRAVIYQAHGYHFFRGAPKLNWLLYYPIEKLFAHYTDCIITINSEDYRIAKSHMKPRNKGFVVLVPGIGIDIERYSSFSDGRARVRSELGIPWDRLMVLSVGELNKNKNHEVVIRSLPDIPELHYAIAGQGKLLEHLQNVAVQIGVVERVHFLGYRENIAEVYQAADIFCLPSYREGLSAALMEAMAAGLPVVCSNIRGNNELISNQQGGFLVNPRKIEDFAQALFLLATNKALRSSMGKENSMNVEKYSMKRVVSIMRELYLKVANADLGENHDNT